VLRQGVTETRQTEAHALASDAQWSSSQIRS
jgi:hypothetical protein